MVHGLLIAVTSLLAEHLAHRLSSCGAWLAHSLWHLPGPGIEPVSLALTGGFLTSGPPGKSSSPLLTSVRGTPTDGRLAHFTDGWVITWVWIEKPPALWWRVCNPSFLLPLALASLFCIRKWGLQIPSYHHSVLNCSLLSIPCPPPPKVKINTGDTLLLVGACLWRHSAKRRAKPQQYHPSPSEQPACWLA